MIYLIFNKIRNSFNPDIAVSAKTSETFSKIDSKYIANVTKYIVYGTHFNIEGNISIPPISDISIEKSDIVLQDINGSEQLINSSFTYDKGILSFSTLDKLNLGLNLEDLSISNYFIFLKLTYSNSEIKYYSLSNQTKYPNVTYYTITKNNSNNKIDIGFDNYNNISYMDIKVEQTSFLPDDVYDIAIDPGHGGTDSGATSKRVS